MRFSPETSVVISLGILSAPFIGHAATADYLLVKDLPFIPATVDIASYLQAVFRLGLGLAVTFAILMLVVNGIRYMISDITGEKTKAKKGMQDAILGLLIVFGSILILNTINPQITRFNLSATIDRTIEAIKTGQASQPPPPPDDQTGDPWPDDASERSRLEGAGVEVKDPACTRIGQEGCTSVHGLDPNVIAAIINLKKKCNCSLAITGGTEYWLHSTHSNNRTVDFRNNDLTTWLGGTGGSCGAKKTKEGVTFTWEDNTCSWRPSPHWHVRF
jgi:hypothetical protein